MTNSVIGIKDEAMVFYDHRAERGFREMSMISTTKTIKKYCACVSLIKWEKSGFALVQCSLRVTVLNSCLASSDTQPAQCPLHASTLPHNTIAHTRPARPEDKAKMAARKVLEPRSMGLGKQ